MLLYIVTCVKYIFDKIDDLQIFEIDFHNKWRIHAYPLSVLHVLKKKYYLFFACDKHIIHCIIYCFPMIFHLYVN